jgi:hypothetical protein
MEADIRASSLALLRTSSSRSSSTVAALRPTLLRQMAPTKTSILSLPISPAAPIYHLHPDPLFPTISSFLALSTYVPPADLGSGPVALKEGDTIPPSMLRRSRQVREGGAFSYTSPLPLEFPYDIQESGDEQVKNVGKEVQARPVTIETKLAEFEPDTQYPVLDPTREGERPTAFASAMRESKVFPAPTLLSFSQRCADEWLPGLETGDAGRLNAKGEGTTEEVRVRKELVDVLAGKTVLARVPDEAGQTVVEKQGFAPWVRPILSCLLTT